MKVNPCETLERGRIVRGEYASARGCMHGAFNIFGPKGTMLRIISSGSGEWADGWEHVSASATHRCPNWPEMCWIKDLFWREDECVVQFHPPREFYVNMHPFCLHLWKPIGETIKLPPMILVGPKEETPNDAA